MLINSKEERAKMRSKIVFLITCLLTAPTLLLAQQLPTPREILDSEGQMKTKLWQYQHQSEPTILDQNDFDVKYWELKVNVTNISGQMITGWVTMTSQATAATVSAVDYDFRTNMTVDSVRVNGQPATFTHNTDLLHINLDRTYTSGEQFTTFVKYHGHPDAGGFGSFTWDTHNGQPIVSTLSEPEGARDWWPCKDMPHDKADSADVYITVTSALTGTSNGVLVSNIDNGNGTRTFHWHISYPITTYLICVSVSNYQSFTNWYVALNGDSMPVTNYVYPELFSEAQTDFSGVPQGIGVFASMFGEYPFVREKYGHSLFPWGGAMEHQDNTSYGSMLITGSNYYDMIWVHELSHQWFGDMITCDIWADVWMNEGFASYCEALYEERASGLNAYLNYMRNDLGVGDPSGPVYNPPPDGLFDGNTIYHKGAWILHILRGVMGDSAFLHGMRAYANDPARMYGTITTRGFQHIMEQYYGADLTWFFDEWAWGRNRPIYRYSWMKQDIGNGQYEVFLHLRQTQVAPAPDVFTMPIKIYPRINSVDTMITVFNSSRIGDYRFIVTGNPTTLAFDKYTWMLRDASSETYGMNIVTTSLPDGNYQTTYNQTIESRGGVQPYHFSVVSGSLPPDLNLNQDTGVLSGSLSYIGAYSFTVRCTDSSSPVKTDDQNYVINVLNIDAIGDENTSNLPTDFMALGNYPNPFNSSTIIRLSLPNAGHIKVDIYNMLGQQIQTLYDGYMDAGEKDIVWDGSSVSSGVYFYKVTSGERTATRKMLMIK
jgi:aminopeptidase N